MKKFYMYRDNLRYSCPYERSCCRIYSSFPVFSHSKVDCQSGSDITRQDGAKTILSSAWSEKEWSEYEEDA